MSHKTTNNTNNDKDYQNILNWFDDISNQVQLMQGYSRKTSVLHNELNSLNELKEELEKQTKSSLNLQTQIIALLNTDLTSFEVRVNEKTGIATQIHKQMKVLKESLEKKENQMNSLKGKLIEINKIKGDMTNTIQSYEEAINSNKSNTLSYKDKCNLLAKENDELLTKIEQMNRGNSMPYNSNGFNDYMLTPTEKDKSLLIQKDKENEITDQIIQMNELIKQLEKRKDDLQQQIKKDMSYLKEKKLIQMKDRLRKKIREKNQLILDNKQIMSDIDEIKHIFREYSIQGREVSFQLKDVHVKENIIKKNFSRKEMMMASLISNLQ